MTRWTRDVDLVSCCSVMKKKKKEKKRLKVIFHVLILQNNMRNIVFVVVFYNNKELHRMRSEGGGDEDDLISREEEGHQTHFPTPSHTHTHSHTEAHPAVLLLPDEGVIHDRCHCFLHCTSAHVQRSNGETTTRWETLPEAESRDMCTSLRGKKVSSKTVRG